MSVFTILKDLQKQNSPKNPYRLYYFLNENPEKILTNNENGFNCFTLTLSSYSKEVFQILLDIFNLLVLSNKINESTIESFDENGNNVYSIVLRIQDDTKKQERLKLLLKANINRNIKDKYNDTPLHIAARHDDYHSVFLLTQRTFESQINVLGKNNVLPIYYTIINKNVPLFKLLLDLGSIIKGKVEGKNIDYTQMIKDSKSKELIKIYDNYSKVNKRLEKQKDNRKAKKEYVRKNYKKLCENLEQSTLNEIVDFAKTINIDVSTPASKQELCKAISQRVLIKHYYPDFSFNDST